MDPTQSLFFNINNSAIDEITKYLRSGHVLCSRDPGVLQINEVRECDNMEAGEELILNFF